MRKLSKFPFVFLLMVLMHSWCAFFLSLSGVGEDYYKDTHPTVAIEYLLNITIEPIRANANRTGSANTYMLSSNVKDGVHEFVKLIAPPIRKF